jgi:hypothetical protein
VAEPPTTVAAELAFSQTPPSADAEKTGEFPNIAARVLRRVHAAAVELT